MSKRHRAARHAESAARRVYGEPVNRVFDILSDLFASAEPTSDGMCTVRLDVGNDECEPFLRAFLRAEAELLIADAARPDVTLQTLRSPHDRNNDALRLLIWRTLAVRGAPDCQRHIQAVLDRASDDQAA